MGQAILRVDWLPAAALDAAGEFHETWIDEARHLLEEDVEALALVLPAAAYDHADWRRAAARDLAREAAPQRVNILAGDDEGAIAAALAFLETAHGITGQLLEVTPRC